MEMYHWRGDWGLPSADPECLAAMTYCKFAGVPVNLKCTKYPWRTWRGTLPLFVDLSANVSFHTLPDIFAHLRSKNWNADSDLTPKKSADLLAYVAYWNEKFIPAFEFMLWMDTKNYVDHTRRWFAKAISFPLGLFVPANTKKQIEKKMSLIFGKECITEMEMEHKVYREARECLNNIAVLLGDKPYLLGTTPSTLDAFVFGYLAVLLKSPYPSAVLQNHLKSCKTLCDYVNRICDEYFPLSNEDKEELKRAQNARTASSSTVAEFPHAKRNIILAGLIAITCMVGYAFLSGLVQIEFEDDSASAQPTKLPDFNQFDKIVQENQEEEFEIPQDKEQGQEQQ